MLVFLFKCILHTAKMINYNIGISIYSSNRLSYNIYRKEFYGWDGAAILTTTDTDNRELFVLHNREREKFSDIALG